MGGELEEGCTGGREGTRRERSRTSEKGEAHRFPSFPPHPLLLFSPYSNTVRKSIARVLTVINKKQRDNLREFYKDAKCESSLLRARRSFDSSLVSSNEQQELTFNTFSSFPPLNRHAP